MHLESIFRVSRVENGFILEVLKETSGDEPISMEEYAEPKRVFCPDLDGIAEKMKLLEPTIRPETPKETFDKVFEEVANG